MALDLNYLRTFFFFFFNEIQLVADESSLGCLPFLMTKHTLQSFHCLFCLTEGKSETKEDTLGQKLSRAQSLPS